MFARHVDKPYCLWYNVLMASILSINATEKNTWEIGVGEFHADASTLGIPAGMFAPSIPTNMGNGRPFLISDRNPERMVYIQDLGSIKLVGWND